MEKKEKDIKQADKILHDVIMKDGEYLKEKLGPVTYENPAGCDIDAGFQKLLKERAKLKAENRAYEAKTNADAAEMESATVEMPAMKVSEFESAKIKKRKTARKGFGSLAKVAVIVLVAGVCIAGFSLQSEATRMWWMESFGWSIGNDGTTKVNNDMERDFSNAPEWEAASIIEKELGIKVPRLQYKPDKSKFSEYTYEKVTNSAVMYYKMGDEYLTINMIMGANNVTSGVSFDGSILFEKTIETMYGTVVVRELEGERDTKNTVIAEWDYQDAHYEIFGRISYEEVKMIVENIVL